MAATTVKLILSTTDEVRRVALSEPSLAAVHDAVRASWKLKRKAYRIAYLDDDGDVVSIVSDADVAAAIAAGVSNIPRIRVIPLADKERDEVEASAEAAPATRPTAATAAPAAPAAAATATTAPVQVPLSDDPASPFIATEADARSAAEALKAFVARLGPSAALTGFTALGSVPGALEIATSAVPAAIFSGQWLSVLKAFVAAKLPLRLLRALVASGLPLASDAGVILQLKTLLLRCGYSLPQIDAALVPAATAAPAASKAATAAAPSPFASPFADLEAQLREVFGVAVAEEDGPTSAAEADTPATGNAVHERVACDVCGASPITGVRYKCAVCTDFDLCGACEAQHTAMVTQGGSPLHAATHPFLKIVTTAQTPAALMAIVREDHEEGLPQGSRWTADTDSDWRAHGLGGQPWAGPGWAGRGRGWMRRMLHRAAAGADSSSPSPAVGDACGAEGAPHPHHHHHGGRRGGGMFGWGHGGRGGGGCGGGGWGRRHGMPGWAAAAAADLRNPAAPAAQPSAPGPAVATAAPATAAPAPAATDATAEEARLLDLAIKESLAEVAATAAAGKKTVAAVASAAPAAASGAGDHTTAVPELSARFIAHLTFADRSVVAPGQAFVKAWRVRNEGDVAWPAGTYLAFVGGDDMGAPHAIPVPAAAAGATVDIAVPLVAPAAVGRHGSYWRLVAPVPKPGVPDKVKNVRFGQRIWADIFVEAAASDSSSSSGDEALKPAAAAPAAPATFTSLTNGNSNAAAVLAALASVATPAAPAAAPAVAAAVEAPAPSAPVIPASALLEAPGRWELHLASLESMGFLDRATNIRLLDQFDGNLMRVVNAIVEAQLGGATPA